MQVSPQNVIRQLLVLALSLVASPVSSLKCEVCSSDELRDGMASIKLQFPNYNSVPPCGPRAQLLDCPDGYQAGCLTQTKGKFMSKMCSNIPVQDCQVANSVEYCYCRGELCNKHQSQPANQVPKATRRPTPPAPTPASTNAPKAPSRPNTRDLNAEVHQTRDQHQLSTSGPEEAPPAAGAADLRAVGRLAAAAALALLACRHILTPNIA